MLVKIDHNALGNLASTKNWFCHAGYLQNCITRSTVKSSSSNS